jgi:cytochrome P450
MPLPFSDVPAFRRDPLALLLHRAASSDSSFVPLYLGLRPLWLATDPKVARAVLKWPTAEIDKGSLVQTIRPLVGKSLLTNTGANHSNVKEAVHRHVHRNSVVANLDRMIGIINQFVARSVIDRSLDTDKDLPLLAFQLACVVVFGHEATSAADRTLLVEAVRTVEAAVADSMFRLPFVPRWPGQMRRETQKLDDARETIEFVIRRVRASEHKSDVIKGLEAAGLDDEALAAEVLGLLIAGHHTTGATMGWLIHHLADDPALAEMIAIEADEVLGSLEENDDARLKQAQLSHAFVSEILRLYPAGWWTSREVFKPLEIAGKKFAVGDTIMVAPWQLHRDGRLWFQPKELRLDRSYNDAAYLPFGVGTRACIGMSIAWFELQLFVLQVSSALRFKRLTAGAPQPKPSITLLFPSGRYEVATRGPAEHGRSAA